MLLSKGIEKDLPQKKLIESRFAKEIRQELQRKLLNSSLQEAIKTKALDVISVLNVENIELEKNRPLRFSAKVATSPVFELPNYTGIELEIPAPTINEEKMTQAFDSLRKIYATYEPVEGRGLELGDFAVLSYTTQVDGKPLEEVAPNGPKRLFSGNNAWIQLAPEVLITGFCEAVLGLQPQETKDFELEVNSQFAVEDLHGKKIAFHVIVEAINKEVVPEWSDELAAKIAPGKTVEELKNIIFKKLESDAQQAFEARKRQGVVDNLLSQVQAEVPSHLVHSEMQKVLREIVAENQDRGVPESDLLAQEHEIVGFAKKNAKDRVLGSFLLLKIAEKEDIRVSEDDFTAYMRAMSQKYNIAVPKLIKDITRKDAIDAVHEEILLDKTLDFVVSNAKVREPASAPTA